jgi:hypothetical protein
MEAAAVPTPRLPGLSAWQLAIVTSVRAAREQLDERDYEVLVDLLGRWFDSERDRVRRGAEVRTRTRGLSTSPVTRAMVDRGQLEAGDVEQEEELAA